MRLNQNFKITNKSNQLINKNKFNHLKELSVIILMNKIFKWIMMISKKESSKIYQKKKRDQ